MDEVLCDQCGNGEFTVGPNNLGRCNFCGNYMALDDDDFVEIEKIRHKAELEDKGVTYDGISD